MLEGVGDAPPPLPCHINYTTNFVTSNLQTMPIRVSQNVFFPKKILYERFPIPMAYIRHHAKFEASRTTSQGRSGITLFSIGICKNRIVQNDKMAITFLFDLQMKN